MRQQSDSTAVADSLPLQKLERASIDVDYHHPLLRLKDHETKPLGGSILAELSDYLRRLLP